MNSDAQDLTLLQLCAEIEKLSATILQLQRAGRDDAIPRLLILRRRAELEDLLQRANRCPSRG
ncbi:MULTISPECIES: hypothetical protein [unclassified Bradyrhizobium]|nr:MULTISPECIES: hypothetical protein [unclassified Bradyrhizobium]